MNAMTRRRDAPPGREPAAERDVAGRGWRRGGGAGGEGAGLEAGRAGLEERGGAGGGASGAGSRPAPVLYFLKKFFFFFNLYRCTVSFEQGNKRRSPIAVYAKRNDCGSRESSQNPKENNSILDRIDQGLWVLLQANNKNNNNWSSGILYSY